MEIIIKPYIKDRINDVLQFEKELRIEEDCWGWEINDEYLASVNNSFNDRSFDDSVSLLAYVDKKVVGRIDSSMITSHFDGSTKAYLDWICVIKSYRHNGVAQALLDALRKELKERNVDTMIALTASNGEAQRFYKAVPNSVMRDVGIWIDIK